MKKRMNWILIAVLAVALMAVVGYIILKQMEYGQSAEFYHSLRGLAKIFVLA